MKTAFIITSIIEPDNKYPLTYSSVRSFFSADERLNQTISTIAAITNIIDLDTTIYLLDASNHWEMYAEALFHQPKLKFISVKKEFPEIFEAVRTHENKSYCECTMLSTFLETYKNELSEFDYTIKISGRYIFHSTFDTTIFNEQNRDKVFYKTPLCFEWKDSWNYEMVDRRSIENDNVLRQYCSVLFGWGKEQNQHMYGLLNKVSELLSHSYLRHYDIETLGYYLTRPFKDFIVETKWIISGRNGCTGNFVRY